jgi:hypothetical protein
MEAFTFPEQIVQEINVLESFEVRRTRLLLVIEGEADGVRRDAMLRKLEQLLLGEIDQLRVVHEAMVELSCRGVKWPTKI